MEYDDGGVACEEAALVIRRYYPWGAKKIPYGSIRAVKSRQMTGLRGKWRIWGSGDFKHWWNLDSGRPRKSVALEIDLGGWIVPTITPDDPEVVDRLLSRQLGQQ